MPSYTGRYDFGVMRQNFGGIQDQASLLTVPTGAARDVLNFDVNVGGEITRRGGTSLVHAFGSPIVFLRKFIKTGTEYYFAITSNNKFWSATTPSGTWTDVSGSVVWTDFTSPIIGASLAGKLVICNGTDAPLVYNPGSNMETLEDASLEDVATTSGTFTHTGGAGGSNADYYLVGVTPRGDTPLFSFTLDASAPQQTALTAAIYNTLSWVNNNEFTAWKVIIKPRSFGIARAGMTTPTLDNTKYYTVATLGAAFTSFNDLGGQVVQYTPVSTSEAYNTPNDWNTGGQPDGIAYVGKNRDERLFAWRNNTIWACSLSESTNWFREDDAFAFTLIGGEDTIIKGIAGLFDYTMIFSASACFLYSGASPTTITLGKVLAVGCASHSSITYVGTDVWWWSQYGPTSAARVLTGADVAVNTGETNAIQNLIFQSTNTSAWSKIAGVTDIVNNRIYWAVPKAAASTNNQCVVFNYEVKGFTRYDGFDFVGAVVYQNGVYVASSDGNLYLMNSGNTDNGTAITASYTTGDMDMGSYPMVKRMLWVDVLADRTGGDYSFGFQYSADMGQQVSDVQTCTQTTTNGDTITTTSSTATEHRIYCEGIANTFRLIFTTSATTPLKLVAWRPEIRARGVRQ